jgi:hypothetical protein
MMTFAHCSTGCLFYVRDSLADRTYKCLFYGRDPVADS